MSTHHTDNVKLILTIFINLVIVFYMEIWYTVPF